MHLITGGYDGSVIGMQLAPATGDTPLVSRTRFAYAPHTGCVKTLAASGHTLVSTGTDERVLVYDLKKKAEYGTLLQHEGTVTCSEFWGGTHLLTGSEDKTVVIWRTKDWVSLHTLRGHKAKVVALGVHPSGKLALAGDAGGILYLWDLTAAKCVFKHRIDPPSVLKWAPDGEAYAYSSGKKAVLSTVGGEVIAVAETAGELKSVAFLDNQTMVLGGDDKTVALWDCRTATASVIHQAQPFTQRVKSVSAFTLGGAQYVAGASADGTVAVYDSRMMSAEAAAPCEAVWSFDTHSRLTCMVTVESFEHEDGAVLEEGSSGSSMAAAEAKALADKPAAKRRKKSKAKSAE